MWQLAEYSAAHGFSMFFLGGRPGRSQTAADRLCERYPRLDLRGCHDGYFDKQGPENDSVIAKINAVRPQILVVGFGMPLQERWLLDNREPIQANVLLTGGGVFDFVSGESRRGPRLLLDHGGEWLVRLVHEPRKLWRRYLIGNPLFVWRAWDWVRSHGRGFASEEKRD
jgi:N-acetylglucosaminyldiphosphoundecaprenol N-acetyl-beta-D-mannosaminyltransferase